MPEASSAAVPAIKSIFQGRFLLIKLLGKGGFGEVYAAVQTSNNEVVAVKMEKNTRNSFLFHEARVMQDIQKTPTKDGISGIAMLKYFGQEGDYRVLIMSLHGASLEDFHEKLGHFSLKTTVMLADQMLSRLEYIHSVGYVHRDLKTDNFLVGKGSFSNRIFMIDFGLSSKYIGSDGKHREMSTGKYFLGTSRFASLRTHQGYSQSRRDDLEQLVYIMIYMYRGRLPWSGLNIKDPVVKELKVGQIKAELSYSQICAKCPQEFEHLLFYARNMEFCEEPQYDMCHALLQSVLDSMSPPESMDYVFDWNVSASNKSGRQPISPRDEIAPFNANAASPPNLLSDADGRAMFSGFGSSSKPHEKIFSIGDRDA
ncbi:putative protein kinase putative casein kinase I [Leptomonas seymouri]|uniref:non-specific serine/threonine protein kinase n=1 Tax=Leptomonas seymouri TaxID=5684 RepID=A0A0N1I2H3_LEPSE|nr:putative protein kinase putative casein kinase I [Leptomonas seymouri]|eukprot:KPI83858.1 putative protein kinase putative casein kinase I [Leptomonas seymouri]